MTNPQVRAVAGKLTEAQSYAVKLLSSAWFAGPRLSVAVIENLDVLRAHGLVDREFLDDTPVTFTAGQSRLTAYVSACWHFRLTPLGLAVREHLLNPTQEPENG